MATQTPEKTNGAPAIQKTAPAARPLGRFAHDPFWGFEAMREMMESMFGFAGLPEWRGGMEPAVNLYESDGAYTLECAVPGYSKDDITVETRGDRVIISGSYEHEKTDEKKHFTHKEIRQGSFTRMIALPQEVDPEQVSAKLENGMLKVTLHPTKAIKSKTIPVTD
jgi:HSP20 family protein